MDETEVKEKLKTFILNEILRRPDYPLTDDEPLITGGLIDSHSLVHIAVFIEEAFAVYIPDNDFSVEKMDTLSAIVARILEDI